MLYQDAGRNLVPAVSFSLFVETSSPPIYVELTGTDARSEVGLALEWLRRHPSVGPHAVIAEVGPVTPDPGLMGDHTHVLELLVDVGFQTAGLIVAILSLRATYRTRSKLDLRRGDVKLPAPREDAGPDEIDEAARRLDEGA